MPTGPATADNVRRIEKLVNIYTEKSGIGTHPDEAITSGVMQGSRVISTCSGSLSALAGSIQPRLRRRGIVPGSALAMTFRSISTVTVCCS